MFSSFLTNRNSRIWLLLLFVFFIAMALFPVGWLASVWPQFDRVADVLLDADIVHVAGHIIIFFSIGSGLWLLFPQLRQRPFLFISLIIALGAIQEGLQLLSYKRRLPEWAELFDLLIDVVSALGAYFLWPRLTRYVDTREEES